MNLVSEHLMQHLGNPIDSWHLDKTSFSVEKFSGPLNTSIFVTVGLSNGSLRTRTSAKRIKHEFMIIIRCDENLKNIPAILFDIGLEYQKKGEALLKGEVIGPRGRIFSGFDMEAFYATTLPDILPDDFFASDSADGIVCIWLLPIAKNEAKFIYNSGWMAFDLLIEESNPDLFDLARAPLVV